MAASGAVECIEPVDEARQVDVDRPRLEGQATTGHVFVDPHEVGTVHGVLGGEPCGFGRCGAGLRIGGGLLGLGQHVVGVHPAADIDIARWLDRLAHGAAHGRVRGDRGGQMALHGYVLLRTRGRGGRAYVLHVMAQESVVLTLRQAALRLQDIKEFTVIISMPHRGRRGMRPRLP